MYPSHPYRTHAAGTLRLAHAGLSVTLSGWIEAIRQYKAFAFITLRESSGHVQLIVPGALMEGLTVESTLTVTGEVVARRQVHPNLVEFPTGEIEVRVESLTLLGVAGPLPFQKHESPSEEEMLRHRPLALRQSRHQTPLLMRAAIVRAMRGVVEGEGFIEVETPVLVRNSPGGATPYLVPVGEKGYALAQSPQIWKQLLMCGGLERYYQLAHCFRNEGVRPERQPEFSQFEIEMAFATKHEVMAVMESCAKAAAGAAGVVFPAIIPRMEYSEAINRFGSDKPHLGNPLEMVTTPVGEGFFKGVEVRLAIPAALAKWEHIWTEMKEACPHALRLEREGEATLAQTPGAAHPSAGMETSVLVAHGPATATPVFVGRYLQALGETLGLIRPGVYPLWVENFPLFEKGEHGWETVHHPFTRPARGEEGTACRKPAQTRSEAFDLVMNGMEVGGGSMRIHEKGLQEEVLTFLGLPLEPFSPLLQSLGEGAPPHGGMALGVERLVAILTGAKTIREVMAFPKTTGGQCLLTGALA
jgi:aspartyl-tRNA synthetase